MMCVSQIIMLDNLKLYSTICQLYLNETGKKKKQSCHIDPSISMPYSQSPQEVLGHHSGVLTQWKGLLPDDLVSSEGSMWHHVPLPIWEDQQLNAPTFRKKPGELGKEQLPVSYDLKVKGT